MQAERKGRKRILPRRSSRNDIVVKGGLEGLSISFFVRKIILNFLHNKTFPHKKSPFRKGDLGGCSISFFVRKILILNFLHNETFPHKKASLFKGRFGGIVNIVRKISDFEVLRSKTYSHKKG